MNMIKVKTAELSGAALDYAVAYATKAWEWAHSLHPAMTLDPTFCAIEARPYPRGEFGSLLMTCVLVPSNPFRQDPQAFCPSIYYADFWKMLERTAKAIRLELQFESNAASYMQNGMRVGYTANDIKVAACRAIVAARLGDTVSVPAELVQS